MQLVSFTYGWKVEGSWTKNKVEMLLGFGSDLASDINKTTGKNGTTWIKNHIGNAVVHRGTGSDFILSIMGAGGMVPTIRDILLPTSPGATDFGEYTLFHEMAHVFDNNVKKGYIPSTYTGGGPSDAMVSAMGGNPKACFPRFACGNNQWYANNVAGNYSWPQNDYANHGVSDDFAETFAYTLMGNSAPTGDLPPQRQIWMMDFLGRLP